MYFSSLHLLISMLLPCWLSSEVSVMRAWTQGPVLEKSADLLFWDAFGAASSTQAVFIKMHETSLCLQQHSGTLTRSERWPRQRSPWVGPETCWYHAGPQGWDLVPWAAFEERNQGEKGGNRRDKKRARVYSGISGHLLDLGAWCLDSFWIPLEILDVPTCNL